MPIMEALQPLSVAPECRSLLWYSSNTPWHSQVWKGYRCYAIALAVSCDMPNQIRPSIVLGFVGALLSEPGQMEVGML